MSRKRSEAAPAKTGRTWSPIKGLTLTERGPLQVQARVRRTGRPSQIKTFETVDEAQAVFQASSTIAASGSRGRRRAGAPPRRRAAGGCARGASACP